MKLEVGMYVRTKDYPHYRTKIAKIDGGSVGRWHLDDEEPHCIIGEESITKHSKDIIDLIEVGDYVNGYKVSYKGNDYKPFVQCDYPVQEGTTNHYRFYEEAIYSILTHEQFESNDYKIEKER